MASFSPEETRRYSPQILLREFGGAGQQALNSARVLLVGLGGLGSPVLAYLAAAGVGTIGILDHDSVAMSNLNRQIVHTSGAIGLPKTVSATNFVRTLNPHVSVVQHQERLEAGNAPRLLSGYQLAIDASDNFATRRVLALTARELGMPLVAGAASGFDGQVTVFGSKTGDPGFSDLYPDDMDESERAACEIAGILGPVTGVIGTLMAAETIKLVTGIGEPLIGRLLLYDGRSARFTELAYSAPLKRPGA